MKYITITVGKSQNPNTGEHWWKADATVSVGENEVPEDVFNQVKSDINKWLPNPYESGKPITITDVPDDLPPSKEQGLIQVIQLCNSVTALERFRPQVEALNNQGVTEAFENKLKSLQ